MSSNVLLLPYDAKSVLLARRFVQQFVAEQAPRGAEQALRLIASELVTNAIVHGAEPIELRLQHEGAEITIEVADGDPRIENVRLRSLDPTDHRGRGLRVVSCLAERWGTRRMESGKTVWAITQTMHIYD